MTETSKAGEIFKKIPAIMKDIEPIAKGRKNQQQGYSYRGVDDVMNELSPILSKHGVFPVTTVLVSNPLEPITSKSGTAGFHAVRTYQFRLYAEDGSFIEGTVEGESSDFGDKAIGKAHSYAYRDFLMKTFVIPTEGDHDTDSQTPEIKAVEKPKKPIEKPLCTNAILEKAVQRARSGEEGIFEKLTATFQLLPEHIQAWEYAMEHAI